MLLGVLIASISCMQSTPVVQDPTPINASITETAPVQTPEPPPIITPRPIIISTVIPTPTSKPTLLPTPTPVWPHEITHYDGDTLPNRTSSGSDSCEYNEQLSFSELCLEILTYQGVPDKAKTAALSGISAIASRYTNSNDELIVDWVGFGPFGGKQNYVGFVLWDGSESDRVEVVNDICLFRYRGKTEGGVYNLGFCEEKINSVLDLNMSNEGAMTSGPWVNHNGTIIIISDKVWDKPVESLGNVLEEPGKGYKG